MSKKGNNVVFVSVILIGILVVASMGLLYISNSNDDAIEVEKESEIDEYRDETNEPVITLNTLPEENLDDDTLEEVVENNITGENDSLYNKEETRLIEESENEQDVDQIDNKKNEFYIEELSDEIKSRITGISYPGTSDMQITYDDLRYLRVKYYDYDGNICDGEIICNAVISEDLLDIFSELYKAEYQFSKIRLIDEYGGDDDASCADDNTSCFNYRAVTGGKKLSKHAYGLAIDINPFYNPYVKFVNGTPTVLLDATIPYIQRNADFPHKIDENDLCYKLFIEHGFKWGGAWNNVKDYQHFEKDI